MGSEICQFALFFGRFDQGVGKAVGVDSIVPTLCVDMHPVTLCVALSEAERGASLAAFPRGSVRNDRSQPPRPDRSHALRGHASRDALRHLAEAERGASLAAFPRGSVRNDRSQPPRPDRSHALRGHASRDALRRPLRSGTRSVPGGIPTREREERSLTAPAT